MILCIIILFFFEGTQEKLSSHDVVLRHWEKLSLSFQQDQRQPKMFKDNRYVDIVIHSVFYLFLKSLFSCHFIVKLMIQLIDWRVAKMASLVYFFHFYHHQLLQSLFLFELLFQDEEDWIMEALRCVFLWMIVIVIHNAFDDDAGGASDNHTACVVE